MHGPVASKDNDFRECRPFWGHGCRKCDNDMMAEVNAARDREATPTSPAEDAPPVATTATPATRQAHAEPRA
eukprot:14324938-Alexandrium_andersonii.AAC.1